MRRDQRSDAAKAYRRWYSTKVWQAARRAQIAAQPLCEPCLKRGRITPARVVNHRKPHKGDWALFIDPTNHQSVCKPCHDGPVQQAEHHGYHHRVGGDGLPLDPAHPFYGR